MNHKSRGFALKLCAGAALLALVAGCSPTLHNRGNLVDDEQLSQIRPGESTRQQVVQTLGSPSSVDPFDQNTWYYVGKRETTWAFFNPNTREQRVLIVNFSPQGVVRDVRTLSREDARRVETVDRTTPTRGQEPNLFNSIYELLISGPVGTLQDRGEQVRRIER